MKDITTTNLADFGTRERGLLVELLNAWEEQGLPDGFYDQEVVPMFNRNSGKVFLTNSEYQVAMLTNYNKLAIWHTCPNCGYESFFEDGFNYIGFNDSNGECIDCFNPREEASL